MRQLADYTGLSIMKSRLSEGGHTLQAQGQSFYVLMYLPVSHVCGIVKLSCLLCYGYEANRQFAISNLQSPIFRFPAPFGPHFKVCSITFHSAQKNLQAHIFFLTRLQLSSTIDNKQNVPIMKIESIVDQADQHLRE